MKTNNNYFFSLDAEDEARLKGISGIIKKTLKENEGISNKIRELDEMSGDFEKDKPLLEQLHDLAYQGILLEEQALAASLDGVRIKRGLFESQQAAGDKKIPDFKAEGIFLQMKEDRLERTMKDINLELDEWLKKLRKPF